MPIELIITIGAIGLGVILFLVLRRISSRGDAEWETSVATMEGDWPDPVSRWSRCVFCIVTRNYDYGHRPDWTRQVVSESWQFDDQAELYRTLEALDDEEDHAWNLVRHILVARMGAGCQLIEQEDSWELIRPVAQRLQRRYESFEEIAEDYLRSRRREKGLAADGSEDDEGMKEMQRTVQILKRELWPRVEYQLDLTGLPSVH